MPYHVAKSAQCPASKPWGVINSVTGDVGGRCHPSQAKARKQMAALYANEPGINMTDAPRDSLIRANLANENALSMIRLRIAEREK